MKKKLSPITPGEILKEEFLVPLSISMSALSRELHVPENRISQIISGKRTISVDTAYRLGKFFKTGPEFWMNIQATYDLRMQKDAWEKVAPTIHECDLMAA